MLTRLGRVDLVLLGPSLTGAGNHHKLDDYIYVPSGFCSDGSGVRVWSTGPTMWRLNKFKKRRQTASDHMANEGFPHCTVRVLSPLGLKITNLLGLVLGLD